MLRYILTLILLLTANLSAQQDHLNASPVNVDAYTRILHIGQNDEFDNGIHFVERSDIDGVTVDTSALAIGDSLVGARAGMHLLQSGEEITSSAADLNLLLGLSTKKLLYDSSNVIVNAPRTIYGWSHDLTFTATDWNTIAWTSGSLYFTNLDTFNIVSGNTGNISDPTWIYFDENASSTVLQTTINGGSAVGNSRIVICVGEDIPIHITKKAVFQVFGGVGNGVFIIADNIVANTITGDEILGNSLGISEINFGTIPGDSMITQINGGGGSLFITADVINAISSSDAGNRIVINPGDNTLKFFRNTTDEILRIGADVLGTVDGMVLDSGMVYISTKDNTAVSNFHAEKYAQSMSTVQGLQTLYLSNDASANIIANPANAWVVSKIEGERNSSNDIYGIYGNISNAGSGNTFGLRFSTIFSSSGDVTGIFLSPFGTVNTYGLRAVVGGISGTKWGAYGSSSGPGTVNYGIYGTAFGATTNWAGYFEDGNVKIENDLYIGNNIISSNFVHPIYGRDGVFSAIAIGNSNMDGSGPNIADSDTASSGSNKSWNNVADAYVTMDYAKTTAATQMSDTFTATYAHPPFHIGKAVVDKYGIEARWIIRATGGSDINDWVGAGTNSVYYDSIRTQLTASGITEIDAVFIHLGDTDETMDQEKFIDSLFILVRQLWAEPEIDSMRTKIIFGELAYNHIYASTNNYQEGAISNIDYLFKNPYVGNIKSKHLPNNGGGDDVHFTAKSNVIIGRERYFGKLESLPKMSEKDGIRRVSQFSLVGDGTFIDCGDASVFGGAYQYYTLVNGPNLAKNATSGDFSLSSDGKTLTIDFDGNLVKVISAEFVLQDMNNSTTVFTYFLTAFNAGAGNLVINMYQMGINNVTGSPIDLLATGFQNGDKAILKLEYLTIR